MRGEMTVVEPQHPKVVHFSLIETLAETMHLSSSEVRHSCHNISDFEPGTGSPMATNVVVLVGTSCCYRLFNFLKLFPFPTDHN